MSTHIHVRPLEENTKTSDITIRISNIAGNGKHILCRHQTYMLCQLRFLTKAKKKRSTSGAQHKLPAIANSHARTICTIRCVREDYRALTIWPEFLLKFNCVQKQMYDVCGRSFSCGDSRLWMSFALNRPLYGWR